MSAFERVKIASRIVSYLVKLLPYTIFDKYIYNYLALEMASPGNQHRANCIGTLSFLMKEETKKLTARSKIS